MALPLGVSPTRSGDSSAADSSSRPAKRRSFKRSLKSKPSLSLAARASLPTRDSQLPLRELDKDSKASRKHPKSLSNKAAHGLHQTPRDDERPRHIPIVVPNYAPINASTPSPNHGSFSSWLSSDTEPVTAAEFLASIDQIPRQPRAKHVEIKIPDFAQPVVRVPEAAPRISLRHSIFDTFAQDTTSSFYSTESLLPDTMAPPRPLAELGSNLTASGSYAGLISANSSQSSLVSQDEESSASEAESAHNEDQSRPRAPSRSTGHPQAGDAHFPHNTPGSNPSNLSGLVCNVHRTTGKEPHPLVGATTTILGDKLYVLGGRRLSRSKPQLTSNLYELDLIRRHWTKLDVSGDIPPPRYFHSVCALGDTKLVCYGGMSPSPTTVDASADTQPEVIVMSDIHIFDVPSKIWMKVRTHDAPQGRYAHCAAILPSSAVFASANAPLSAVHHNPSGSNPNQGTIGVSLDGTGGAEMVVVGGQDSGNHYIEQISVFNLRSLKWTVTTSLGRQCGASRSVVTPLTTMSESHIGAGPHSQADLEDDDEEPAAVGSGAPMLIYSNYNFLDVKLELQVRRMDGSLTEKQMQTTVSPPGLRFPNGGVIANHFVVSGTFLTSSKQEYALWALDLRTLTWSRIDAGGSIFSQGSWNRGVLWSRRNAFVILGNRKRSLVDDYNNRRINFTNICLVELEAFGLYDNPRRTAPTSSYLSASASYAPGDDEALGKAISSAAEELGSQAMNVRELADMDFLAIDGTRIPVNSKLITRRWGAHFTHLLRESLALSAETDTATLRPSAAGHPSRNSSVTITPSVTSGMTTLTANSAANSFDVASAPPATRPRLFYLPHTAPTLQALLHYLYTSSLPQPPHPLATPQIYCSLLQLARPYKIDGLLEAVVQCLHDTLDGRNAAAIFNAAAMGAGGGEGVHFLPSSSTSAATARDSAIPLHATTLPGFDGLLSNGAAAPGSRAASALRIDTDMANVNGRSNTRNTLRPGQPLSEEESEDEPGSATTDASASDFEGAGSAGLSGGRGAPQTGEIWKGAVSAVVGLQKRGLRGLMEGRRMRERGKSDGQETRVGLGIV